MPIRPTQSPKTTPRGARAASERIVVVSGLPRSGTSLVMQMLAAGGLPLLVDSERPADVDNPRGYHELSAVKSIDRDSAFLAHAAGRAVKIVAPLVRALPGAHDYDVLFVRRDLAEVLASQAAMLARHGMAGGGADQRIRTAFESILEKTRVWLARQPNVRTHFVDHAELLADPRRQAERMVDFLGSESGLEADEMARAVDPGLYRCRARA